MGYEDYKSKRTHYKGVWFKSNLEARVAQAFNTLGIAWEYERQCFRDERFPYDQYTPDFHLPNSDRYVEVCVALDEKHKEKLSVLCDILGATEDTIRIMVIDGDGTCSSCYMNDGRFERRAVIWSKHGNTDNLFDAAGMRRWNRGSE